jgi:meso-butanediol dehydrogenase/(S,S)-butanediol dehydrogenase/diacetyl reductase
MAGLRLAGKVALITGAGSGIGKATALLFTREGAAVLAGTNEAADLAALEAEAGGLPGRVIGLQMDVSREEDAARAVHTAVERFGGLDILVNNAGIAQRGLVTETSEEQWNRIQDVNLKGVFLCSKYAISEMLRRGGGSIVNTASINGIRGNHRLAAYCASKGGVVALTYALALDYAPDNIRVNCVCPAAIAGTRMSQASLAEAQDPEKQYEDLVAKHPMNRLGLPGEVASAILFLASDEASFITGVALPVDGGRSIR